MSPSPTFQMYLETLPRLASWPTGRRPWLICMDLQRDYVVPGRPRYASSNAAVAAACADVLCLARDEGWRIVHSQLRTDLSPQPRAMFGAPIEGLRPLIVEPVFFRSGLSAFADPAFAAELRSARGKDVFLIGFSVADTCLATALAAVDAGVTLTLVEEAVAWGERPAVAEGARAILEPFVRIVSRRSLEPATLEAAP